MEPIDRLIIGSILAFVAGIVTLLITFNAVLFVSTFGVGAITMWLVVYSGIEEQADDSV